MASSVKPYFILLKIILPFSSIEKLIMYTKLLIDNDSLNFRSFVFTSSICLSVMSFKKAGANSILMSLWEVNDEATQILMTHFYKNLVSGQSKRQSLQSAQRYLREYNAGQYDKPEYWAAFILLDGIEK